MRLKNPKVFYLSIIALICLIAGFTIHWLFIAIAVAIMLFNQKELLKNKK